MLKPLAILTRKVLGDQEQPLLAPQDRLLDDVERARKEWRAAQAYFEQAKDPQEVDFASYNLKSAEQRYMNLWREARQLHLRAWSGE